MRILNKLKDGKGQYSLDMFIEALVMQEETSIWDSLTWLLPILCCLIFFTQGRGGGGGGGGTVKETVSESWYTVDDIETMYKRIEATVAEWRKEAEEKRETSKGGLS